MDRLIKLGQLCDYYGALLTERQRKLLSQYADENLSLAEIAELEGVSRQAVRDGIVHAEQKLQGFEQALHLMEKTRRTQEMAADIRQMVNESSMQTRERDALCHALAAHERLWEDDDGV